MDFLLDPNVSYVLLVLGFLIGILALFAPGTGVLEIVALLTLVLAGYGIVNHPLNFWAIVILILALVPFLVAIRQPRHKRILWLVLAALAFALGSAFMFQGEGWRPAVNPILILILSPLIIILTWFLMTKSLEAVYARPVFDLGQLVGMTGQASSDIRGEGTVYVNGETWTAYSKSFIPAGSPIRVLRRRGLALDVEPASEKTLP